MMSLKTKTIAIAILSLFFCQNMAADATPFKRKLIINLDLNNSKKDSIRKVCILYGPSFKITDTVCGCDGSDCLYLENKTIHIERSVPENFKLLFTFGNKTLISPTLNENDSDSLIELKIADTEITETTPFFRVPISNYILALFLTIIMELLFGFAFFLKHKINSKNILYILLVNLISHPALWLTCSYFIGWGINLLFAEIIVTLFEAILLTFLIKPKLNFQASLRLSCIINSASFIFGGILYLILS